MKTKLQENAANIISAIALFFSMLAIFYLLTGNFYFSFASILLALVFDSIDGHIARLLKAESKFGSAVDGYVDVVNYLIYPSLAFFIYFRMTDVVPLVTIFIFVLCGIYRLARFQVNGVKRTNNKMFYEGLPVFVSPFLILIFLLILKYFPDWFYYFSIFLLVLTSFLMVQSFKFPKPKNVSFYIVLITFLSLVFILKNFQ